MAPRRLNFNLPLPGPLKALPPGVIAIIGLLVLVNAVVWAVVGVVLHYVSSGSLISAAVLSYTLGLRHARTYCLT